MRGPHARPPSVTSAMQMRIAYETRSAPTIVTTSSRLSHRNWGHQSGFRSPSSPTGFPFEL